MPARSNSGSASATPKGKGKAKHPHDEDDEFEPQGEAPPMRPAPKKGKAKGKAKQDEEEEVAEMDTAEDEEEPADLKITKVKGTRAKKVPKVEKEEEEEDEDEEAKAGEASTPNKGKAKAKAKAKSPAATPSSTPTPSKQDKGKGKAKAKASPARRKSFTAGDSSSEGDEWLPTKRNADSVSEEEEEEEEDSDFESESEIKAKIQATRLERRLSQEANKKAKAQARARSRSASRSTTPRRRKAKSDEEEAGEAGEEAGEAGEEAGEAGEAGEEAGEATPSSGRKPRVRTYNSAGKRENVADRVHRLHPEIHDVPGDLKKFKEQNTHVPQIAQPQKLLLKLLPFQLEGVSWMVHQEDTIFHGGILADEMGMGKTIQTISLALAKRSHKPSLFVCPAVALLQWRAEIEAHTEPGALRVLVYHGQTRKRDSNELCQHDIVLTTYSTVESEWRRQQSGFKQKGATVKEPSVLHGIGWHRIVLDEAHFIKDRSSNTARAVFGLNGDYKWSLSGTPLQNRVGELYSLIKFLKADPFSYYFCKQCDCKSLSWMFSDHKNCDQCGHKGMSHFCWWNREILKPIQKYGATGPGLDAYKLLHELLGSIMLRRTKMDRGKELGLPPRIIHKRRDLFSVEEEDFYEALFSESKTKFESFVQAGTVLNNYAHIFELLMRMRQAVNHPWLVTHRSEGPKDAHVCGICHEEAEDPIISSCKHVFCREDMRLYISSSLAANTSCPVCFRNLSIDLTQPELEPKMSMDDAAKVRANNSIVRRLDMEKWRSSTKIEALLEEFEQLKSDRKVIKSIVFSQFTKFLDLLEWRLNKAGIRSVKLDGRMTPSDRASMIEAFNTIPTITVFLISLKAGGLALNLTTASRVYIMDPWWNPAVENQAMDRIHRLGQYRPIEVRRMIIENSIESRIDELQQKKHLLFESTVGGDDTALNRLTEEDLRFLFVM